MSETYLVFTDEAGVYNKRPNEKFRHSHPLYIRSNVRFSADDYRLFQSEIAELNEHYSIPVSEEIKWSDLWEIHKGKYRSEFLKTKSEDTLKGYYRRVFNRAVDKKSLEFIFTVTCVYTQTCYQSEEEILKFHLQESMQRVNMDAQPNDFATIIMDELKYHPEVIDNYHYILVDESHRFYPKQFDDLCNRVRKGKQICVFSSDPEQVLSSTEKRNAIVSKISSLPLLGKYELSEKIRTNKELASFIISVRNLNRKPHIPMKYDNVSLAYANSIDEAKNIIEYYRNKGYTFINYSKSNYNYSPYTQYEEDFDTHHVIGQEFDNVLMLMDKSFYYDTNNILQGIPHPNPDYLYPNLFYQGITRVREKIALVVVDAPELFEKISSIVD